MAVAVKTMMEVKPRPLNRLAVGSLAGTAYVIGSLVAVFYALPTVWDMLFSPTLGGGAIDRSLLLLTMLAAASAFIVAGKRLLGTEPVPGVRAGVFTGLVLVLLTLLLTRWIGGILEGLLGAGSGTLGLAATCTVGLVLLLGSASLFFRPKFDALLLRFEHQGWFTTTPYKKSQGIRVRRGTIFGIICLAAPAVFKAANSTSWTNWTIRIPFSDGRLLTLLPDARFTVPILLTAAILWISYRLVNFPGFADFLIATEAELNKVSWTTRKRLVQDTIVVLTTMFFITFFLFIVDMVWVWALSRPWIQVIRSDSKSVQQKINEQDY